MLTQYGREVFIRRATFHQDRHSAVYGTGRGYYGKKDGTEGRMEANVYSLLISDLPGPVAEQVGRSLQEQLARVDHTGVITQVVTVS